jgi:LL-diaminopimelate aminotransferase
MIEIANRIKGVKPYYFVKKLEQVRELKAEGHDVINFGIGSPDLAPDESVIETLNQSAQNVNNHGYQPYGGLPELKSAICKWYKNTYQVDFTTAEVLPLAGSKEGILHTTLAFVNPGDEVLIPNPGYPTYRSLSTLLGAKVVDYNLKEENNWQLDFDELEKLVSVKTKLIWVNYPHMPTGTPSDRLKMEQLIVFAKKHKLLICHDNPYSLVLNEGAPQSIFQLKGAKDVAIEFNSLSKSHNMAGWRVGMILGDQGIISNLLRVKSNIDSGMFKGTQEAAIEALNLPLEWHQKRNTVYEERQRWVFKIYDLLDISYDKNQLGMFVWGKPKSNSPAVDIDQFIDTTLKNLHIFFTPGKIFGSNGENYLRSSLCVDLEQIKKAYLRLSMHFVDKIHIGKKT